MLQVTLLIAGAAMGQSYDVKLAKPVQRYVVTVDAPRKELPKDYWPSHWPQPSYVPPQEEQKDYVYESSAVERLKKQTNNLKLIAPRYQEEVRQPPRPFSVRVQGDKSDPLTAEVESDAASSWQWSDEDVPEYMERYTPGKYTQSIFKNQFGSQIRKVPRTQQEEKWRVPGGLAGIGGWESELWRWSPRQVTLGSIPVLNRFGYFQNELGYRAKYEPGAEFLDVLRNRETGKVFEVRKAMKTGNGWQRFVTYRRAEHRPRGYHGPKGLNCHSCHDEAGTGGYATGLVPGGDTVLSVPFDALEN